MARVIIRTYPVVPQHIGGLREFLAFMSVQALIDRATDPILPSADWTVNFQVVDAVNANAKLYVLLLLFS